MDLNDLSGLLALILAVVAIGKGFYEGKKIQKDASKAGADAITSYEQAADIAAERALKLTKRIKDLEDVVEAQGKELEELKDTLEDVQDWAERLVHQVQSLGGVPVKIRIRKKKAEQ